MQQVGPLGRRRADVFGNDIEGITAVVELSHCVVVLFGPVDADHDADVFLHQEFERVSFEQCPVRRYPDIDMNDPFLSFGPGVRDDLFHQVQRQERLTPEKVDLTTARFFAYCQ